MLIRPPHSTATALVYAVIGLTFAFATAGYLIWRTDQPPWDPGGPLGGMPWPYLFWNWIAICPGPYLTVVCLFKAGRYCFRQRRKSEAVAPTPPDQVGS